MEFPKTQRLVRSAAAEVFGTFEQLQNILHYHAARNTNAYTFARLLDTPVESLFVLQRVNHTLKNTIADSKNLRQYMFLESQDRGFVRSDLQRIQSFWWLKNSLEGNPLFLRDQANIEDGTLVLPVRRIGQDMTSSAI
ncbi:hypothetical protein DOTSEDRAFT_25505 [Dothistroma septosporum NZE10]|uniref:Uncharacterized protein n=1 Tax=Dothistroma septosporum (strain NZE10 / CBS 128990) TaxID=675120 RepID=M2YNJ1_DOTSN|nr:hypothetical protein DOTSEDRAFT_25505 [Dothistroma septosporum NZE10]